MFEVSFISLSFREASHVNYEKKSNLHSRPVRSLGYIAEFKGFGVVLMPVAPIRHGEP